MKGFDPHRPRRNIALKLSYMGQNYSGFAAQDHDTNTIEHHFLQALQVTRLAGDVSKMAYCRAGRTDRGVSAAANVVSLYLRTNQDPSTEYGGKAPSEADMPDVPPNVIVDQDAARAAPGTVSEASDVEEVDYPQLLNAVLPAGIKIVAWAPVPVNFNARFNPSWREYRYHFGVACLDLSAIEQALASFVGRHDFSSFCKMDVSHVHNFHRRLLEADLTRPPPGAGPLALASVRVRGQAFLWHQIRAMMAVLLMVGQGLEAPDIVDRMLAREAPLDLKPNYVLAADGPLCLMEVGFVHPPAWRTSALAAAKARAQVYRLGVDAAIMSAVAESMMPAVTLPAQEEAWHHPSLFPVKVRDGEERVVYMRDLDRKHIKLEKRQKEPGYEDKVAALERRSGPIAGKRKAMARANTD